MPEKDAVLAEQLLEFRGKAEQIRRQISQVLIGKGHAVDLLLVALVSGGHVLIEDLPGTGKTTLAKAFARSLELTMSRIQFTPDLIPSDVTGYNFFDQKQQEFRFRPGPVMANLVLADEVNRTIPRTQSSLLEAMGEGQVTVDGVTRPLPRPFLVIATQNPVEIEGTFPLPEAQLDRFLVSLRLGYPSAEEEDKMLLAHGGEDPLQRLQPVMTPADLERYAHLTERVQVEASLRAYLIRLVEATRSWPGINLGASPRATLGLFRAARGLAALRGRLYVLPDDFKELAVPVLGHRLVLSSQEKVRGKRPGDVVASILQSVPVPVAENETVDA